MNRQEAEAFVYRSYLKAEPFMDYHARDARKRHPELTEEMILARCGTPCAVITGSKGKGSAAVMMSEILGCRMKTGLMTSPHLTDFCERFRVGGIPCTDEEFAAGMTDLEAEITRIDSELPDGVCISPVGIQAVFALDYFRKKGTAFNIFECGKGARYDDVTQIRHEYAVINSIFAEHTRELGDTPEEIAQDKAHVITGYERCAFTAPQSGRVMEILRERAAGKGVPLREYGRDFRAEKIRWTARGMVFDVVFRDSVCRDMAVPLLGEHQARNCALAMAACREIAGLTDEQAVRERLSSLSWPGRMEVLSEDPFVLLDACIHPASCGPVLDALRRLGIEKPAVIIGIPDDKDYAGVARAMKDAAGCLILTKSQNPHYRFSEVQRQKLLEEGINAVRTESLPEACALALRACSPVVILGTTSLVSEAERLSF
ncbi:MAG: bifunctional protein FolC [Lachnospiraceae bacterium]|nr:bifunctional protein FolC [Lachnospiraceae bacterium]